MAVADCAAADPAAGAVTAVSATPRERAVAERWPRHLRAVTGALPKCGLGAEAGLPGAWEAGLEAKY
jgi:hypothetical protein